jgi:hypothetical protein
MRRALLVIAVATALGALAPEAIAKPGPGPAPGPETTRLVAHPATVHASLVGVERCHSPQFFIEYCRPGAAAEAHMGWAKLMDSSGAPLAAMAVSITVTTGPGAACETSTNGDGVATWTCSDTPDETATGFTVVFAGTPTYAGSRAAVGPALLSAG